MNKIYRHFKNIKTLMFAHKKSFRSVRLLVHCAIVSSFFVGFILYYAFKRPLEEFKFRKRVNDFIV